MEALDARGPIGPLNPAGALRRAVALVLTAALYACGGGGSPGPDPVGAGSAEETRQPMGETRSDTPEARPGKIEPFVAEVTTNSYLPVLSLEMGELPQYELPVPEGEVAERPRRYGSIDTPADADRYHLQHNGTLDWTSAHSMQLGSIGRLALPTNTVAIPATVRPGQSVPLSFDVKCNSSGPGGFSATLFGVSVGRNLYCQ